MPRFFFDFHQAGDCVSDSDGLELADADQAYLEVFKAAQEMWSELLRMRRDPRRCAFHVRSEQNDSLFVFPFQEVIDCCKEPQPPPLRRAMSEASRIHDFARRAENGLRQEINIAQDVLRQVRELLKA